MRRPTRLTAAGPRDGSRSPSRARRPVVYLVVADLADWEAGSVGADIPATSLAFTRRAASALMKARATALDALVDEQDAIVQRGIAGGYLQATGGLSVLLRLYAIPLSHVTAGAPPVWDLQEDYDAYLERDESYLFSYESGHTTDRGHWDDLDLRDYLPPVEHVLAQYAEARED